MSYILFLDDERTPPKYGLGNLEVVVARNLEEFKKAIIERGEPYFLDFDWYLGVSKPSGIDAITWLIEHDKENNLLSDDVLFDVHSSDMDKNREMYRLLEFYLQAKFKDDPKSGRFRRRVQR